MQCSAVQCSAVQCSADQIITVHSSWSEGDPWKAERTQRGREIQLSKSEKFFKLKNYKFFDSTFIIWVRYCDVSLWYDVNYIRGVLPSPLYAPGARLAAVLGQDWSGWCQAFTGRAGLGLRNVRNVCNSAPAAAKPLTGRVGLVLENMILSFVWSLGLTLINKPKLL